MQKTDYETDQYFKLRVGYTKTIKTVMSANKHYVPFLTTTRLSFVPLNQSSVRFTYRYFGNDTWHTYSRFYRHLTSELINNFTKKQHLYPRTYDFLDVNRTKENPFAQFTENTIPHIHSIYLIHEDTLERWNDLLKCDFAPVVTHPVVSHCVSSFHAVPVTSDLPKAVSYCSKFYDNRYARSIRNDHILFNHFPLPKFEQDGLREKREDMPFFMFVEANRQMKKRAKNI